MEASWRMMRAGRRREVEEEERRGRLEEVDGWWNGTENEKPVLDLLSILIVSSI